MRGEKSKYQMEGSQRTDIRVSLLSAYDLFLHFCGAKCHTTLIHSNLSSWGWWREPVPRDLTQAISSDLPPSISPFSHKNTHPQP